MAKSRQHAKKLSKKNVFYGYIFNGFSSHIQHPLPSFTHCFSRHLPHLSLSGFSNMLYFHPFPTAGRRNSKSLGSVVHQLLPAFFSLPGMLKWLSSCLCSWGWGQEACLPCSFPSAPQSKGGTVSCNVLAAEKCLENILCLPATAAWELKGRLFCYHPCPYFQTSGNFPGMPITSLQNGLAGRSSYGWAWKGQKLEPALYFFIRSRK